MKNLELWSLLRENGMTESLLLTKPFISGSSISNCQRMLEMLLYNVASCLQINKAILLTYFIENQNFSSYMLIFTILSIIKVLPNSVLKCKFLFKVEFSGILCKILFSRKCEALNTSKSKY